MKQLYFLLLLFTFSGLHTATLQAQQLVWKSTYKNVISEKYLVLKKDKSVREGQYLRLYQGMIYPDYLMEIGQYVNNQKSGTWMTFFHRDPNNSMESFGDYKNDQKEGMWHHYYGSIQKDTSVFKLFGSEKRTRLIPPTKGELEYKIELNPENHVMESSGVYLAGKKAGDWEFYDFDGNLVHTFNYSSGRVLPLPNDGAPAIYLGGSDRFRYYLRKALFEVPFKDKVTQYSEAVFELGQNGTYQYVSGFGDAFLKDFAHLVLKSIPNEWVYMNEGATSKLHIVCKAKVSEDRRKHGYFNMELQVVE